ncbi:putative toxin-antitoxin system toxin component, PIN family [Halobacteriales archaeon SW_10_68_16]|jgi:putative PIN family toxin of toxin-antitoxin system|nr:MAG: putative toxin-antitoxin system toxin component, PIN family [Halobacteriales archaeon SW_10_68_16]
MGATRVVFDTNVLVSALGFGGPPLAALLRVFDADVQLLASRETLDELDRVMRYDRLPFTVSERKQYLRILRDEVELIRPDADIDAVARDPDDNMFLECAVDGEAQYLVSGDDHLRDLGSFRDVRILSPAAFLVEVDDSVDG